MPPNASHENFDPARPIRNWSKDGSSVFRISDALTGVAVFGATGSGKTSGPAKHLANGYLAHGFGGLVLCAKKEERKQWVDWARETHRLEDILIVDRTGNRRFNFLDWEAARPGEGGGLTINLVALLDEISKAVANDAGDGGGGDNRFFSDALRHMNTNLIDLVLFCKRQIIATFQVLLHSIIIQASQSGGAPK